MAPPVGDWMAKSGYVPFFSGKAMHANALTASTWISSDYGLVRVMWLKSGLV